MNIWIFSSKKGNLHLGLILLDVPQPSDVYLHGAVVSGDVVAFGEESMALVGMYPTRFQYRISPFSTLLHIGCYNATRERQYNAPRLIPSAQSAEDEEEDALGSKEVWDFQMPRLWLSSHGRYTLLPSNA